MWKRGQTGIICTLGELSVKSVSFESSKKSAELFLTPLTGRGSRVQLGIQMPGRLCYKSHTVKMDPMFHVC